MRLVLVIPTCYIMKMNLLVATGGGLKNFPLGRFSANNNNFNFRRYSDVIMIHRLYIYIYINLLFLPMEGNIDFRERNDLDFYRCGNVFMMHYCLPVLPSWSSYIQCPEHCPSHVSVYSHSWGLH